MQNNHKYKILLLWIGEKCVLVSRTLFVITSYLGTQNKITFKFVHYLQRNVYFKMNSLNLLFREENIQLNLIHLLNSFSVRKMNLWYVYIIHNIGGKFLNFKPKYVLLPLHLISHNFNKYVSTVFITCGAVKTQNNGIILSDSVWKNLLFYYLIIISV